MQRPHPPSSSSRPSPLTPHLLPPPSSPPPIRPCSGREQIFRLHLRPLTLNGGAERAPELANRLAALTPGMSGAEIANVCNEAALIAARHGAASVGMGHLDQAVDRVLGGLEKKSRSQLQKERVTVAWHEAGHAVAGWFLPHADPVMKVRRRRG